MCDRNFIMENFEETWQESNQVRENFVRKVNEKKIFERKKHEAKYCSWAEM